LEKEYEGKSIGQEDVRQMQAGSSLRRGARDLREPEAQAEAGLGFRKQGSRRYAWLV
jgi:hypothetical protein